MLDELIERFQRRDRLALSRLLTLVARGEHLDVLRDALSCKSEGGVVVAITGSAGVGKSSLIGKLAEHLRNDNKSVAVVACDPQSPLTGGALLGDRIRMPSTPDDGLFIRSLAVGGGQQAIAPNLDLIVNALCAFEFDYVLVETVGAGQGDTAVKQLADFVVVLVQPESGDELQWEKAGMLEIADVVVVHKSDLPGSDQTAAQLQELLNLPGCREVPVLQATSKSGNGVENLGELIKQIH